MGRLPFKREDETEWVELVDHGFNFVAGINHKDIYEAYEKLSEKKIDYNKNLFGDGRAGEKIVKLLYNSC